MLIAILGATSALAHHTAREFARRERASFLLVGRQRERLETVAADLRAFGAGECRCQTLDFSDPAAASAWLPADGPGPDLVLIAHGSLSDEARAASDPQYATAELDLNFGSTLRLAYAAAADFERRGAGHLAIVTSVAGERGRASNFFYGAAKAGLIAFCSGLRARLSRRGIALTELRPGSLATPMTAHLPQGALFCPAEKAGRLCAAALRRRADIAWIPGWWRWIMLVIRWLPERVFKQVKF
ncbi:MAG: SDR family NAD(P)-dependent oxidoreductase [Verrucomicrobia bacterium]|nr:SDR family NAD(P)-dependent oxidoreductase [Verrucomicrobiota bacterium]